MEKQIVDFNVISFLSKSLALRLRLNHEDYTHVIGITRGGIIPATIISYQLNAKLLAYGVATYNDTVKTDVVNVTQDIDFDQIDPNSRILVVDDICDSGETFEFIKKQIDGRFELVKYAALFTRERSQHIIDHYGALVPKNVWVSLPWE